MESKVFPLSITKFIKQNKLVLALAILIFLPSLFTFFSGDDWSHLRLSQINSFPEFINFFSFSKNPQTASFYRPLPTQVFFFAFFRLFTFHSFFYHLFVMASFLYSLYLLYSFSFLFSQKQAVAKISLLIYALSATNFTRLYFLSAFQEVSLVIFVLLSLIYFIHSKKTTLSLLFFILALMSKETAIILPLILLTYSLLFRKKISLKKHYLFWLISLFYLALRFFLFRLPVGDSYIWNFSPRSILNTLFWYLLWSLGTPELLVDYISSGLMPLPRLFTDYPIWSYVILFTTVLSIIFAIYIFIRSLKQFNRQHLFSILIFLFSISPLLPLPWHKFTLELGLPLVGFSLFIALILINQSKNLKIFLTIFISLNLFTNCLTYTRHYSVQRSKLSLRIYQFLLNNYPNYPQDSYFEFINDTSNYGSAWGSSKQISHITSSSDMFQVIYNNHQIEVFFADTPAQRPIDKKPINISTKQFFR